MTELFSPLRSFALVICLTIAGGQPASAYMLDPIAVGNWEGGAYYNDGNRLFSHCAVGVEYLNGVTLILSWQTEGLAVGFVDSRWNAHVVGSQVPIRVAIDTDRWVGEGAATVVAPGHLSVIMGREPRPVTAMRRGLQLTAALGKETLLFDLTSTNAAIDALANCYRRHS